MISFHVEFHVFTEKAILFLITERYLSYYVNTYALPQFARIQDKTWNVADERLKKHRNDIKAKI